MDFQFRSTQPTNPPRAVEKPFLPRLTPQERTKNGKRKSPKAPVFILTTKQRFAIVEFGSIIPKEPVKP